MGKSILYVNACVRKESRTRMLAEELLSKLDRPFEEIRLEDISFPAVTEEYLTLRDQLIQRKIFKIRYLNLLVSFLKRMKL